MSLLSRLFGGGGGRPHGSSDIPGETRPAWMGDELEVQVFDGPTDLDIVGEASYQDNLWKAVGQTSSPAIRVRVEVHALLVAETDNPYDRNAISAWVNLLKVGYLSRENAQRYRAGLLALEQRLGRRVALPGVIVGGGMYEDGPGRLGLFLRHDPKDFGLRGQRLHRATEDAAPTGRMMTGLSEAIATDAADDNYDLSWVADIPSDPIRAISMLRGLLENERDPISRHFVFHHLEQVLYQSRDAFTSALDEYDDCCHKHDVEMETIRPSFMAKWNHVPWLDTYKQMCIRLAKDKRYAEALRWAERGLSFYGKDAARPDAVADLLMRAESYRVKLAPRQTRSLRPAPQQVPQMETITCANCGRGSERVRTRGRKPTLCEDCRMTKP